MRIDDSDERFNLGQALIFGNWQIAEAFQLRGLVSVYDDGGDTAGVNELYINYRPSMEGRYRIQGKVGTFFPKISLENTRPGWTSINPITNAAINSWIAEEVRITGGEFSLLRLSDPVNGGLDYGLSLGLFANNDPTGAMLSWRGWALHDRQMRLGESISIAPRPAVGTDIGFVDQEPYYQPFVEIDDTPGYFFSVSAAQQNRFKIRYDYYDNRADPEAIRDGQYGWRTKFSHLGLSYSFTEATRLYSQWLEGSTFMGIEDDSVYIDNDFQSWYLGVSQTFGNFQLDLRYDDFSVRDRDSTEMDNNDQDGDAIVLALRYDLNESVALFAEYVDINETKAARVYQTLPAETDYALSQLVVQWRF